MNLINFFEQIGSLGSTDITDENKSRKDALKALGGMGKKMAIATIPGALLTLLPQLSRAQTSGESPVDVLQFALLLEQLEQKYYDTGVNNSSLVIPASDRPIFQQILDHENEHVTFLSSTLSSLGVTPNAAPTFDFTVGGAFNPFGVYAQFMALAQAFEDTGVRAYKGQAQYLTGSANAAYLQAALQIHSVEARHASEIRRLRGNKGWITEASADTLTTYSSNFQLVYNGEDNRAQGGVTDVSSLTSYGADASTEAFDEPLDKAHVTAIASLFIQ